MKKSLFLTLGALAFVALGAGGLRLWQLRTGPPAPTQSPMAMPMSTTPSPLEPPKEIEIEIPKESLPRLQLKFAQVVQRSIKSEIRAPGTVQPNAYKDVHVTPLIAGVVTQVSANLGQSVKRGQALAQLFSRE